MQIPEISRFKAFVGRIVLVLVVYDTFFALDIMAKLFFFLLELSFHNLVGLPDRLHLKQSLNRFQGNATGFGDEEEGKHKGKERQGCEKHVNTISHGGKHLLGKARDQKVEEPVAGGCARLGYRAEVGVEEFLEKYVISGCFEHIFKSRNTYRVDDPRCTVPSGRIDGSPQVEEDNSSIATTSQVVLRILCRVNDIDICTDNPHANRTSDTTDEEKLSSSELIDKEE